MIVNTKIDNLNTKRNIIYNSIGFVVDNAETIGEFSQRIRFEKNLSVAEVSAKSGNKISPSYISKLENEPFVNPSAPKLQALAKGLGEDEELVFAIARGQNLNSENDVERIELEAMYRKRRNLSPARKEAFKRILDMVDRDVTRNGVQEIIGFAVNKDTMVKLGKAKTVELKIGNVVKKLKDEHFEMFQNIVKLGDLSEQPAEKKK